MNRQFNVRDRVYELIPLHLAEPLFHDVILAFGKSCQANMGQEDGEFIYLVRRLFQQELDEPLD